MTQSSIGILSMLFILTSSGFSTFPTDNHTHTMSDTTTVGPDSAAPDTGSGKAAAAYPPVVEDPAFSIGEKLTFSIGYGFIRAGTATMSVEGIRNIRGHETYHIRTTAESDAAFSWIYRVEDVIDSYMDRRGLFSRQFDKRQREGSYKVDLLVSYFPEDSLAKIDFTRYGRRMRVTDEQTYEVKTPPYSYDILAAFYYTRSQDLQVGESIYLTNHDNKKVYELEVRVYRKEIIETSAGTFRCLMVEPLLEGEGVFKQEGRLQVWLTDDEYKIPVLMTSQVVVGHISAELEKIEGIPEPIPARISTDE